MLELQNDCSNVFQLLIGYENGTVVFWDLKSKRAELRVYYDEVSDFCWNIWNSVVTSCQFFTFNLCILPIFLSFEHA